MNGQKIVFLIQKDQLCTMIENDEILRYIEYLQRQLVTPGTESLIRNEREWFEANRERLREKIQRAIEVRGGETPKLRRLEDAITRFEAGSDFDSFHSSEIFSPFVEKISTYMRDAGIGLSAGVTFASSPATGPSPAARASVHGHVLFAGRGTYAFCNYWAKIFAEILVKVARTSSPESPVWTRDLIDAAIPSTAAAQLAVSLTTFYAVTGSVIGFGRFEQADELMGVRVMILNSMEAFIVGHEMGHFSAEEEYPETNGLPESATQQDLEIQCDAIGLSMLTAYGAEHQNPFVFQGLGPVLLFWALKICEDARAQLLGVEVVESTSHPSFLDRIALISSFLSEITDQESRHEYLQSMENMSAVAESLNEFVQTQIERLRVEEHLEAP